MRRQIHSVPFVLLCGLGAIALSGCSAPNTAPAETSTANTPTATSSPAISSPATSSPAAAVRSDYSAVPLVPDSGVALGVYYGDGTQDETDNAIGVVPQIHLTYFGWEDPWTTDPVIESDADEGRTSLVNWEPFGVDFADIVAGKHDDLLAERAAEAASLPAPVFLDFAAEMNEGEGWGDHQPDLYIDAYRHVHNAFEGKDGGNIVWVWAPNNTDSADAPPMLDYYPGDDYVDWTGIDGYNWGTAEPGFEWQSFSEVFRDAYNNLQPLGRPILIGETASADDGGSKAEWVEGIVPTLETEFPDIRAVVWFDVDKERDWRIRSSDAAEAAFREMATSDLFHHG